MFIEKLPAKSRWLVRIIHRRGAVTLAIVVLVLTSAAFSVSKPHVVVFGKWTSVQWFPDSGAGDKPHTLKVRALLVDARVKEFTVGPAHDVTERLFVVQRAFRINDSLPQESESLPRWQWQEGGWLLVDRVSGHVSAINLPDFDVLHSAVSWYRDYAAYCGVSDDGKKVHAVVAQLNRRKAVLKKAFESVSMGEGEATNAAPDVACPVPEWQRAPVRVTFDPPNGAKQTFAIRGHAADLVSEDEDDEEASR